MGQHRMRTFQIRNKTDRKTDLETAAEEGNKKRKNTEPTYIFTYSV